MNIPTNLSDNTIELDITIFDITIFDITIFDITIFDIKIELHCRLNSTVD